MKVNYKDRINEYLKGDDIDEVELARLMNKLLDKDKQLKVVAEKKII